MKFSTAALSLAALAATASAQLDILVPGGDDLWWLVGSDNVVSWTCTTNTIPQFTVLVQNSNPSVLNSPLAIIAQQNNFDCSKLVTKDLVNLPVATGYQILFANTLNSSDIYATSKTFEIKPVASGYPPASATPTGVSSAVASSTGTASGSGSTPTSSANSKSGAFALTAPGTLAAAAFAVLGLFTA
ncbi:uncharacterized protein BXZ73DRAFT_75165 [Epithele typhae]|uniref:uncharacterized protein n=1 Tax=Epithele typhae TaxID=378194 RepID=UPI0020081945|nr:uncharacterized protein BXZ73DRAFT_75165 [Epithele typhae]KAH9941202.1 hypothetical protein BXZ73DRAFT_75165 [Epithele typhae]